MKNFLSLQLPKILFVNSALILGILACNFFYVSFLLLILIIRFYKNIYFNLIIILFFFIGLALHKREIYLFYHPPYINAEKEVFNIRGIVEETSKNFFFLKIDKLESLTSKKTTKLNRRLKIYTYDKKPNPYSIITLKNITLKKPKKSPRNQMFIRGRNLCSIFVKKLNFEAISSQGMTFFQTISMFKFYIWEKLKEKMNKKTFSLFSSLFLGKRYNYSNEKELFKAWGISHFLARSGMHLIIFIIMLNFLLTKVALNFIYKKTLELSFLILYYICSFSSLSFDRAFIVFVIYNLFLILDFQINYIHILNLTSILILLNNPTQIFFLDFQLSFSLSMSLAWLNKIKKQLKIKNVD